MVTHDGFDTPDRHVSMTPDELSRFVRMEEAVKRLQKNDERLEGQISEINKKLDRILEAAAIGKGAWWMALKVGGALTVLIGLGMWIWEQVKPL